MTATMGTGSTPPLNWTYKTAVSVDDDDGSALHSFWIDTPEGTDLFPKDLPYYGSVIAFLNLPRRTVLRGQDDSGDCLKTFDEDCVRDTLENARRRASSFDESRDRAADITSDLMLDVWASSCDKYIDDAIGNTTSTNGTKESECPDSDEGADRRLATWGSIGGSDSETAYDREITRVRPVLTVVFPKQNSTIDQGWVDARLVCMRGSEIAAGSREPDGVPAEDAEDAEESSGVKTITGSMTLFAALALGFGLAGIL
ncbi:MAG: hypothetical protein Q9169_001613 [Polycauliona sp. 2 TL-2023]